MCIQSVLALELLEEHEFTEVLRIAVQFVGPASWLGPGWRDKRRQQPSQFIFMAGSGIKVNVEDYLAVAHFFTSTQACREELSSTESMIFNCRSPSANTGYSTGACRSTTVR